MPNLAVVIGIDRYATDLTSLSGAVRDAQDFATWLVESGEVAVENLRLGLWPGDESPPLPALLQPCPEIGTTLDELDVLISELLDAPPNDLDRLYFYFAGHGAASVNPLYAEDAICLQGFSEKNWRRALEVSALVGALNGIASRERFILLDGCRNMVFKDDDDIRFGTLSRHPRPAKGERRNYVLRATGAGREAAEVHGRGLFTRHLCDGLRGAGAAKRWDSTAAQGEGGYVVRWRALGEYVATKVSTHHVAQRIEQLVADEGQHPASEDPLLASFPAQHFGLSKMAVRLIDPAEPPAGTIVFLRRNDSADEGRCEELPPSGSLEFELPPSVWVLWARAAGWRSQPRARSIQLYAERVEECIALVPEDPPKPGPSRPRQPTEFITLGSHGALEAPRRFDIVRRLHLRVGGHTLTQVRPPVRVSVRRESGEVVVDPVLQDTLTLAPGFYRVRLDLAGGAWLETPLLIAPGEQETLDLALPDTATGALTQLLSAGLKPPPAGGFASPSEQLGPLAAPSIVTVAAIAVVEAVQGDANGLARLQIGTRWARGDETGLEVMSADECELRGDEEKFAPHAQLWRMQTPGGSPMVRELVPTNASAPIKSTSLALDAGGYWLQFTNTSQARRGGFTLSAHVLPGHVTLVVRHQQASGAVSLFQFAVPRDPTRRIPIQLGLVQAEAFQRARAAGLDPTVDPTVHALAKGEWFEPFSAMVAASALLGRGEAGHAMFEQVVAALVAHGVRGPDVLVLRAARAARAGQQDASAALIRDALGLAQAPLVDALLEQLDVEAQRLGIAGERAAWITSVLRQSVGHPLWTLRRESDIRGGRGSADSVHP